MKTPQYTSWAVVTIYILAHFLEIEPDLVDVGDEIIAIPTQPIIKVQSAPSYVPPDEVDVDPNVAALETVTRTRYVLLHGERCFIDNSLYSTKRLFN